MNDKLCKRLRKAARMATIGKPERFYVRANSRGQIRLHPESTRGLYRQFKKVARNVSRARLTEVLQAARGSN